MEFTSLNTVQPHSRHIDSQCIIYGHRAIACTLNENTNRYIVFGWFKMNAFRVFVYIARTCTLCIAIHLDHTSIRARLCLGRTYSGTAKTVNHLIDWRRITFRVYNVERICISGRNYEVCVVLEKYSIIQVIGCKHLEVLMETQLPIGDNAILFYRGNTCVVRWLRGKRCILNNI